MRLIDRILDWLSGGGESRREFEAIHAEVCSLTIAQARAQMEPLLADPARYDIVEAPAAGPLGLLPATAAELFGRYASITERYGDTELDRGALGPSEYRPGCTRIGADGGGHAEIAVSQTDDTVYRVDASDQSPDEAERFPSVYHLLLFDARIIYLEAFRG